MPKYTTPQALWETITGLQSVGGTQFEGNTFINETLRYVDAKQGIDVEYKNRLYGDGMDADGLEQLNPTPLPVSQQGGDVVEDRDKRKSLGTFPISNRGFWEDINFNPATLQPYLTSDLRKTVETEIVSVPDADGSMVYKKMRLPDQIDRSYSIDALPFVTDPNNDDEIIRVDRYYDKEINPNEYKLTTEGKVNYFLYPRESGRISPDLPIDIYKSRNKKSSPEGSTFDRAAKVGMLNKNSGYFVFNLDWGDGTPNEHDQVPKLLESSVILNHTYEKPGFYTITGTVFLSYGFRIRQYERFETRIFLNPSKKYNDELDLLRNRNFAMIGGISTSSTLVKSVSSTVGLDPFDFSEEKTKPTLLEKYNELDAIELLNFMNMIDSNKLTAYQERYIEPYSKVIEDEPTTVLEIPQILGCMDTNADNYVGYATVNNGCHYSYSITGNINGLGGKEPIFFIGEVDYDEDGDIKDRYFLFGGAYSDWNGVVTQINTDEFSGNKFALIVAPSTIYPSLALSDDVPFDGWTIPDGLRIAKLNYSDEGTPIVTQTSGNDLPGTLSGQGYGYEVDVPINPYENVDGNDRIYVLTIDPNNPPSETNYTDKEILVNWSGDTEDISTLSSGFSLGTSLFYATFETEVIDGPLGGMITLTTSPASGQDGFIAGDEVSYMITPPPASKILHIFYNEEEVLADDERIGDQVGGPPLLDPNTNSFGDEVQYTFNFIAETDNLLQVMFEELTAVEEVVGDTFEDETYDQIEVRLYPISFLDNQNDVNDQNIGAGSVGVKFVGTGGSRVPPAYGNFFDSSEVNTSPLNATFIVDEEVGYNQEVRVRAQITSAVGGDTWKGWYKKNPYTDPDFDEDSDLLTTDLEYSFVPDSSQPLHELYAWAIGGM